MPDFPNNPFPPLTEEEQKEKDKLLAKLRGGKYSGIQELFPADLLLGLQEAGINSAEGQLWRLENPQYENDLQNNYHAKPITQPKSVLQVRYHYADQETKYNAITAETAIGKKAKQRIFLARPENTGYAGALQLIEKLESGLPEEYGGLYLDWQAIKNNPKLYGPYEADWLLLETPGFYDEMVKAGVINETDFSKVPTPQTWADFQQYKKEPDPLLKQKMLVDNNALHDFVAATDKTYKTIDTTKLQTTLAKRDAAAKKDAYLNSDNYKYFKSLAGKYQKEQAMMKNPDTYKAWVDAGVIKAMDFTDVPTEEIWTAYKRHRTIPDEAGKLKDFRENPNLYKWMVQTGKTKPLAAAELATLPTGYVDYLKAMVREKQLGISPTGKATHPLPERVGGIRGTQMGVAPAITGGYMVAAGSSEMARMQSAALEDYLVNVKGLPRKYHAPEVKSQGILEQEVPQQFKEFWPIWTGAQGDQVRRQSLLDAYPEFNKWYTERVAATRPRPAPTAYPEFAAQREAEAPTYPPFGGEPILPNYEKLHSDFINLTDETQKQQFLTKWPGYRQWINQRWKTNY